MAQPNSRSFVESNRVRAREPLHAVPHDAARPDAQRVVRVWFTDLRVSQQELNQLSTILSSEERERACRYRFEADHRRFIVARACLHQILAAELDTEPSHIRFRYGSRGKPALAGTSELHFNLSHSFDIAAIAVAHGRRVGIDIEVMRDNLEFEEIARSHFTAPEADRVARKQGPDRRHAFYTHWTGKEAYVKAHGDGLFARLDSFEVIPSDCGGATLLRIDDIREHGRWCIHTLRPAEDIVCSVVVEGQDSHIEAAAYHPLL